MKIDGGEVTWPGSGVGVCSVDSVEGRDEVDGGASCAEDGRGEP